MYNEVKSNVTIKVDAFQLRYRKGCQNVFGDATQGKTYSGEGALKLYLLANEKTKINQ